MFWLSYFILEIKFLYIMFFFFADIPHGNEYFQNLVDIIEDPMEEDIDVPKES